MKEGKGNISDGSVPTLKKPQDFSEMIRMAKMEREKVLDIYSYDTDFDDFPDLTCKEPKESSQEEAGKRVA